MYVDDYIFQMKLGYFFKALKPIEAMIAQREIVNYTYNEAALIFGEDEKLKALLKELTSDFISLSERFLELSRNTGGLSDKGFIAIGAAYPELEPVDMPKILNHPQACAMFVSMCTTSEVAQWEKDANIYVEKFSYDKFDILFKKHLVLKPL